jgi:hypothetical protein
MLIDSELVGTWMASAYLPDGVRIDYKLVLNAQGSYEFTSRPEAALDRTERGTWMHEKAAKLLHLKAEGPVTGNQESSWQILQIPRWEEVNTILVLRWLALASRNLPVLYYRVHLGDAND